MMQTLIVALLVAGCASYAAWTLMPGAARRAIASSLLKLPLPQRFAAKLDKAATAPSGCGCDGCDKSPANFGAENSAKAAPKALQVVTFHPRPKRR